MWLQNKKFILFLMSFLFLQVVSANEGKKQEPSTEGTQDKKQQERTKEWMDLSAQVSSLKTKLKAKEENIKEIIKHKNHATTKSEAEHAFNNLKTEHAELIKLEEEYNSKVQLIKYRYPDIGLSEKRKYERLKIKSLEDYEKMMGIEAEIKKSVIRAKEHYGIKDMEKESETHDKKQHTDDDENDLAKPIIIRK